jgi:protein phosphatase
MATTVVCATVGEAGLHVAWAGDSRCYLYSGSVLRQVTQDHSEVERLVDLGLISREDAKVHPLRHTITRYLGQAEGFAPDTVHHALSSGDVVILSTDGLTDVVSDRAMAEEIGSYHAGRFRFEELPDRLVERALQAGTHDNVTVLVCGYKIDVPSSKTMTGAYPVALSGVFRSLSEEE